MILIATFLAHSTTFYEALPWLVENGVEAKCYIKEEECNQAFSDFTKEDARRLGRQKVSKVNVVPKAGVGYAHREININPSNPLTNYLESFEDHPPKPTPISRSVTQELKDLDEAKEQMTAATGIDVQCMGGEGVLITDCIRITRDLLNHAPTLLSETSYDVIQVGSLGPGDNSGHLYINASQYEGRESLRIKSPKKALSIQAKKRDASAISNRLLRRLNHNHDFRFICNLKVDASACYKSLSSVTPELIEKLSSAGIRQIQVGARELWDTKFQRSILYVKAGDNLDVVYASAVLPNRFDNGKSIQELTSAAKKASLDLEVTCDKLTSTQCHQFLLNLEEALTYSTMTDLGEYLDGTSFSITAAKSNKPLSWIKDDGYKITFGANQSYENMGRVLREIGR